jgi:uncharacterized protein (DUF302 family)
LKKNKPVFLIFSLCNISNQTAIFIERILLSTIKKEIMNYYFSKTVNEDFDTAIEKVTEELKKEGFGILTQIDIKETLKKKLDVDFKKYRILGACNPKFAYEALKAEDKIGTMLPCNVIVQEHENGKVEISAVDPVASMLAVKNDSLGNVATQVREKLNRVINNL